MTSHHVIPLADLHEHDRTAACPCCPSVETLDNGEPMFRHNSYDGREDLEARGAVMLPWVLEHCGGEG